MTIDVAPETRRLSDAELVTVMGLIRDADSVELKASVPTAAHRATVQGLPLDPVEAQPRQVYFFDTPELTLNRAGLVVRARRIQGGRGDTVVKLRPVVPAELPPDLRREAGFNVEVDMLPGGYVCSASLKGRTTGAEIRDAVHGKAAIRRLFTKAQRALFVQHAPEGLALDDLTPLGPTFVLKARFAARTGLGSTAERPIVAEMWLYPDGSRILELSTKCVPAEAFQVAMEVRAYLAGKGVDLAGVQQTKTRAALEFYSGELSAATSGSEPGGETPAGAEVVERPAAS
jgi:hypothetical protein